MKARNHLALLAVLLLAPPAASAQQSQPSLANSPNVVQWTKVEASMAELLQQGYRLVSVNEVITNPPVQDVMTTYYLARGADLVRCEEGLRLVSDRFWVTSCARITKPYEVKDN
jgi:hypothetical protein